MNLRTGQFNRSNGGYLLVEYMIYIALLALVMGLAFSAFYRFFDHSRDLTRNSDDILRTLRVGELWRADIRQAIAPPEVRTEGELVACEIARANGRVAYIFAENAVWRQEGQAAARQVLPRVGASAMNGEERHGVVCWRWELELQTRRKIVRVRPLFSFRAVPSRILEAAQEGSE
jgi:hypothetical protein